MEEEQPAYMRERGAYKLNLCRVERMKRTWRNEATTPPRNFALVARVQRIKTIQKSVGRKLLNIVLTSIVIITCGVLITNREIIEPVEVEEMGSRRALVCVITAAYGNTINELDTALDVRKYHRRNINFYFFTNSETKDIETPGWFKIIKDTPYKRRITQSRWPKFQGWTHPLVQKNCESIFYVDASASFRPRKGLFHPEVGMNKVLSTARKVLKSEKGLAMVKHPENRQSITDEFRHIIDLQKDIQSNTDESLKWLRAQDDFDDENIQIYENKYFCYNPNNPNFRTLSNFFWSRYSLEVDSWRDQPLWAYTLHHFSFTPNHLERRLLFTDVSRINRFHQYTGTD